MKTVETNNEALVGTTAHRWEVAGLGKAPFRFLGWAHKVGPIRTVDAAGFTWEIGAPGQPMSSCDFCGQAIALVCTFKSVDGRTFNVGCDCAEKSGDEGVVKYASAARRAHNRKITAARKETKVAKLVAGAETTHADILSRLDRLAADGNSFARRFASDVAKRIRSGSTAKLSPKQVALIEKLEGEAG